MSNILEVVGKIKADNHVSTNELRNFIAEILADSEISSVEFAAFTAVLNQVSGNADNSPALKLVAKLVASLYFLEDDTSPGVLTADEESELTKLVGADGKIDEIEAAMVNFVKTLALQKGELSRPIMEAPSIAEAIAIVAADGHIDNNEAKSLYFRVRKDGDVDNEELAALVELNNKVSGSPLWMEIFPVLVLSSVLVDGDDITFDISEEEGAILMKMADNGLDAPETEALETCVALAATVDPTFADWWAGTQKAA